MNEIQERRYSTGCGWVKRGRGGVQGRDDPGGLDGIGGKRLLGVSRGGGEESNEGNLPEEHYCENL